MRQTALTIAVVALLALAGCSSSGGPTATDVSTTASTTPTDAPTTTTAADDPTTSDSPTVVTMTTTQRPTVDGVALPPGTNRSGVVDEEALFAAFDAALTETDYVVTADYTETVSNMTSAADLLLRVDQSEQQANGTLSRRLVGPDENVTSTRDFYANGSQSFARVTGNDTTSYETFSDGFNTAQSSAVQVLLRNVDLGSRDWELNGTTSVHGEQVVRFSFTDESLDTTTYSTVAGTLLVDSQGVVHSLEMTIESADSGNALTMDYEFDSSADVTVQPPGWLEQARNATG